MEEHGTPAELESDVWDDDEVKREMKIAVDEGRRMANKPGRRNTHGEEVEYWNEDGGTDSNVVFQP